MLAVICIAAIYIAHGPETKAPGCDTEGCKKAPQSGYGARWCERGAEDWPALRLWEIRSPAVLCRTPCSK